MASCPNILFITDDQHHAGCFSGAQRPQVRTPNIDVLVREGVSFQRSYSCAPECIPSRISMLTGRYVHTHGVYAGMIPLPANYLSFPQVLHDQLGYSTALVGKKHYAKWTREPFQSDTGEVWSGYSRTYLEKVGWRKTFTREYHAQVADFMAYTSQVPHEHSEPVWVADTTIRKIDDLGAKPFLIWCNFSAPHPPYCNSFDSPFLYAPEALDLSAIRHCEGADLHALSLRPGAVRMGVENAWRVGVVGEAKYREALAHYYGMCTAVDDGVGRILQHLEKRGILENTIILFNSDHGDFAGEYGMLGKNTLGHFECLHRIPTVWYWKGRFGPERIDSFVENIDIFPTLCELVGAAVPCSVQGASYAEALRYSASGPGPIPVTKEAVFFDTCFTKSIRTRRYRLTYCTAGENYCELFDHQNDPQERINRFGEAGYAGVQGRLLGELLDWTIRTEQPLGWELERKLHPPTRWYREHPHAGEFPEPNRDRIRSLEPETHQSLAARSGVNRQVGNSELVGSGNIGAPAK